MGLTIKAVFDPASVNIKIDYLVPPTPRARASRFCATCFESKKPLLELSTSELQSSRKRDRCGARKKALRAEMWR